METCTTRSASFAEAPAHLVLQGSIVGPAVGAFAQTMDTVLGDHEPFFVLDLAGVDRWSLLAQAMVLTTARRKAARGEVLMLSRPSAALREQSRKLGLFERVVTADALPAIFGSGGTTPPAGVRLTQPPRRWRRHPSGRDRLRTAYRCRQA